MRHETVARNYAEALFTLGERRGESELYGELIDAVAAAVDLSPIIQRVMLSPRVPKAEKARLLAAALEEAPREFVLFLQAVVKRGRQGLLREIALEHLALLDEKHERVRAVVTLARTPDAALRKRITAALERVMEQKVIARFEEDRDILGGAIVRVKDRVFDGSVRRRLTMLRRQLLSR